MSTKELKSFPVPRTSLNQDGIILYFNKYGVISLSPISDDWKKEHFNYKVIFFFKQKAAKLKYCFAEFNEPSFIRHIKEKVPYGETVYNGHLLGSRGSYTQSSYRIKLAAKIISRVSKELIKIKADPLFWKPVDSSRFPKYILELFKSCLFSANKPIGLDG
jgi:hypothetical protein